MFKKLSEFIVKKYKLIFTLSIAIFVMSILVASQIGMDSNMDSMLPANSKSVEASQEYEQFFDSQDNVLVVVKGEAQECEEYMEALNDRLQNEKLINNILYKVDTDLLSEYIHLYVNTSNYKTLERDLNNPDSLLSNLIKNKDFISLSSLFLKRLEDVSDEKREHLLSLYIKMLTPDNKLTEDEQKDFFSTLAFGEIEDMNNNKYLASNKSDTYLMIVKPNIDYNSFMEDRNNFFETLKYSIEETKITEKFDIEAGITGGAFVQDYEGDTAMFDGFLFTALLAFLIIILFIVLSFKRFLLPISSAYPLLLGALLSTAFAYLTYKNLNMFSISFAVLLLGLGIDFGVHIISRYLEERSAGNSVKESVMVTISQTSSGMFIAAVTTSVAFSSFLFAEFRAFTQMGVISGAGIILLCITMIMLVPTIILLFDIKKSSKISINDSEFNFLRLTGKAVEKNPIVFIVLAGLVSLLLIGNVLGTNIKTDISQIYPQNMECLTWLEIVEGEFEYNPNTLIFMVDTIEDLKNTTSELLERSDIKTIESILDYLPEDQEYKVSVIGNLNSKLKEEPSERSHSFLTELVNTLSHIKDAFDRYDIDKASDSYKIIDRMLAGIDENNSENSMALILRNNLLSDTINISELLLSEELLSIDKLPENILANFVGKEGKLSVEVVPDVNIWDRDNFNNLANAIKEASGRSPIGMPAIMNEVTNYAINDIIRISFFCIIFLFIILFIMFKKFKDTMIILIPLLLTIFLTLGVVPLLKIDLNIFSLIAFPVLIGIGVDSGVHLLHRIKNSPDKNIPYILSHTGKAVMMTTTTTLIGFGSLCFTNHPGLSSFGLVTLVGMSLCLIITITMLPSLYLILYSKNKYLKVLS